MIKMKIGIYTEDEILEHLTEGEGRGFLGRSMYDAIFDKIHSLKTENEQLKQWDCNKDTRNSRQRIANDKLQKENKQLKEELKATKEVAEEHLKKEIQYKEVIEEIREYVNNHMYYTLSDGNTSDYTIEKAEKELLQILDKGVDK